MELVAENAVTKLIDLCGPLDPVQAKKDAPHTIRACCGTSKNHNAIHCSDDLDSATEVCLRLVYKL